MNNQMPVIILAGGFGTRISEETETKPKPMVRIGSKPILEHLIDTFISQGFSEIYIAAGYMHEVIDDWLENIHISNSEIISINTGLETQTGGRIKKVIDIVDNANNFIVTYGDGLANVNLNSLISLHQEMGKLATVTSVRPPARFGVIESVNNLVSHFGEKIQTTEGWINGGYFVLNRKVSDLILNDSESFEFHTLPKLVRHKQLATFKHEGFWKPMDTLREKQEFEKLLEKKPYPWQL